MIFQNKDLNISDSTQQDKYAREWFVIEQNQSFSSEQLHQALERWLKENSIEKRAEPIPMAYQSCLCRQI